MLLGRSVGLIFSLIVICYCCYFLECDVNHSTFIEDPI